MNSGSSINKVVNRKNSASRGCAECVLEPIEHFVANTSIHGFQNAFEPKRRFLERCIWIASLAVCIVGAITLVNKSYEEFYKNPTITTVRSFTSKTYRFPFPAITFCNVNLVFRYKVRRLLQSLKIPKNINMSRTRLEQALPNVGVFLRPHIRIDNKTLDELHTLQLIFDSNNITTTRVVRMLSQSCSDMIERCSWNGVLINCNTTFQKTATYKGYCCSFNYEDNTNWTGHPDQDPYKLRTFEYGPGSGLQILLNPMENDYMWGAFLASGFSVVVHGSGVYPEGSCWFIGQSETFIRITPDSTDGDLKLKTVQSARRACTFFDERPLKTTKTYSREACALECRAQAVQTLCGCVPLYYIELASLETASTNHSQNNESLNFCNLNHTECLQKYYHEVESETTIDNCHCWPQCILLKYDIDIRKSNFEAVEHYVGDFYEGLNTSGRVSVNVYIGSQVTKVGQRDIVYTIEQLMSNLGGLFSLFLGCSFLSAMEIIYYSLLRAPKLCCRFFKSFN